MEAPAVTVTPEAATFARSQGGALTLRRTPRHGCCGGTVSLAVVEATAPADPAGFARHDLDDLTVYVEPGLTASGPLRVGLDRLFGLRSLFVEGAETTM
ncbi:MAG: CC/Se motif family (seleno)protein [Gemmatimonadota bacterium]